MMILRGGRSVKRIGEKVGNRKKKLQIKNNNYKKPPLLECAYFPRERVKLFFITLDFNHH